MTVSAAMITGVLLAVCAPAQSSPQAAPAFEAASVKPAAPSIGKGFRISMDGDPGRIHWTNVALREMIRLAYELKDYQIAGPDWINTERFDVTATLPAGAPESQKWQMLQTLLAERFRLAVHREKRELPAYVLMVANGGVKMKPFADSAERAGDAGNMTMGFGRFHATGIQAAELADMLSRMMDRPVVDETGLTQKYEVDLRWTPEPSDGTLAGMKMGMAMSRGEDVKFPETTGPTIVVALQQELGLKLEAKKLPIEALVIDHAEKVPTEN